MAEKRSVAVSYNWNTKECLTTDWDGDGAADKAAGWVHPHSFIQRDFPQSDGWTHFAHWNKEAAEERGARLAKQLLEEGRQSEKVPQ